MYINPMGNVKKNTIYRLIFFKPEKLGFSHTLPEFYTVRLKGLEFSIRQEIESFCDKNSMIIVISTKITREEEAKLFSTGIYRSQN